MKRRAIGGGAYVAEDGRFWERPGGKTWRLLRGAATQRQAIRIASLRDPLTVGKTFEAMAHAYKHANCPDGRLDPRGENFCKEEKARVDMLLKFFGDRPADKIFISDIPAYRAWRAAQQKKGITGNRSVDKETQTLSNVYRYATVAGLYPVNPVRSGRPRYQTAEKIRHSRERSPKTADICHRICETLLNSVATETIGWFGLFAMFTGCRLSELLRLRVDAADDTQPGYIQWRVDSHSQMPPAAVAALPKDFPLGLLHIRRSKGGLNPECIIGPDFADMIETFHQWHSARFPASPWYFPNQAGDCIHRRQIYEGIVNAAGAIKAGHRITPHGFRSFYVTKRRSDGASDTIIASEIGDKTVALMQTTYGERPKNWLGGDALDWLPKEGKPAWEFWLDKNESQIDSRSQCEDNANAEKSMFTRPPVWRNGRRTGLKILGP